MERQKYNIMKRNQAVGAKRPAVMSRGELLFCLRDVQCYWSTPHITPAEIECLERLNLIQRAPTGLCAIRLTEQGALVKQGRKDVPGDLVKETFLRSSNGPRLSS